MKTTIFQWLKYIVSVYAIISVIFLSTLIASFASKGFGILVLSSVYGFADVMNNVSKECSESENAVE